MSRWTIIVAILAWFLPFSTVERVACGSGSISGHGRFERITGNPAMGYKELYEWDLYLSPDDNSMVGPSRRLGAPPGQVPTGDGYYRIDDVPAGTYSVYVNQPDFFASPQVVPDVEIRNGQTTQLNVDLDVDYSTYFRESNEWTNWGPWDWYQTFTARGTSVRGISWVMAGWGLYGDKQADVRILEDNGQANVRNWKTVGSGVDKNLGSDSDEWVRWDSGDVPMTPGRKYAVNIHVDGGLAIYKRNKDAQSYQGGRAYDQDGNPQNFDLNVTVFADRGEMVTHTTKSSGPGDFDGGLSDTRWGQTFRATGSGLAAVDLFAASGQDDLELTWKVRRDGPNGQQIGPTKTTRGAYFASSTDLVGVSFNPDEVRLVPGETYYIEAASSWGFTPYTRPTWEQYGDGTAFRRGTPVGEDLSMTIVQYAPISAPATVVGRHVFYNNSSFDGYNPNATIADDLAVATDKTALLPGNTATSKNYTSYSRGINGIMVDLADLPDGVTPTAADFEFRVGNDDTPDDWQPAPNPSRVVLRPGAEQSDPDRVAIVWTDYAVRNQWLQVRVRAERLGLEQDDIFYFGNAVAEACNESDDARVTIADLLLARNNPRDLAHAAAVDDRYDYNRDRYVNATDVVIARHAQTSFLNALELIAVPPSDDVAQIVAIPEPSGLVLLVTGTIFLLVLTGRKSLCHR